MADVSKLFNAANLARSHAYAPYSEFHVGVALISETNALFTGCNVENAAYPVGICAEAGAIAAMVAAGHKRIAHIMIVGSGTEPCFPCGACRQRIAEFASTQTQIYVGSETGFQSKPYSLAELLPFSFKLP